MQQFSAKIDIDCRVASLLAMTVYGIFVVIANEVKQSQVVAGSPRIAVGNDRKNR
jgi:hypothetical protein